ncbi:hypothetical protein NK6_4708 [Bradyrhizobium diazoefficiens]|uniref:Uncharacterized protein n=1 Tax=Bradyrhizobium diazoefficiens TaxID=1355477 RepID=A0A0E4FUG2_9BRAD|nr:hypothetical protein NK6_4708 [Bradyrhizobium diazoefficiens]
MIECEAAMPDADHPTEDDAIVTDEPFVAAE